MSEKKIFWRLFSFVMISFIVIVVVVDRIESNDVDYVYLSVDEAIADKYPNATISKTESGQYYLIYVDDGESNNFPLDIVHVMDNKIEFFSSRIFKRPSLTTSISLVDYGIAARIECYFDNNNYVIYIPPNPGDELRVYDDKLWGYVMSEANSNYWFNVIPEKENDYVFYIEMGEKKYEINLSEALGEKK